MVCIPKPKPDQVIRHEIVLGRSEREIIKDFQIQLAVKNFANVGTEILKDTTALIALFTLVSYFYPELKFTFPTDASPTEIVESGVVQYQNWQQQRVESGRYDEAAGSLFGGIFNLISNLFAPILDPPEFFTDPNHPFTGSGGGGGGSF